MKTTVRDFGGTFAPHLRQVLSADIGAGRYKGTGLAGDCERIVDATGEIRLKTGGRRRFVVTLRLTDRSPPAAHPTQPDESRETPLQSCLRRHAVCVRPSSRPGAPSQVIIRPLSARQNVDAALLGGRPPSPSSRAPRHREAREIAFWNAAYRSILPTTLAHCRWDSRSRRLPVSDSSGVP